MFVDPHEDAAESNDEEEEEEEQVQVSLSLLPRRRS